MTSMLRMPAEHEPHERTLMAWPTRARAQTLWRGHLDEARRAWAEVASTIARFEPVTMVVRTGELDQGDETSAVALLGGIPGVSLAEHWIDDSWLRDSGPIVLVDADDPSRRVARTFEFNAWGDKFHPYGDDASIAATLAGDLGLEHEAVPFVFEGGSIAVDGAGTLVTTEQCLLNENRGLLPDGTTRTKERLDIALGAALGVTRVVWLEHGLADDDDTDGHADNVVAFTESGGVLAQGCDDPDDPDHDRLSANAARLIDAGLDVIVIPVLPKAECLGEPVEVPYLNYYVGNGFVLVPVTGHPYDDEALATIRTAYPTRDVVPVDGSVIAYGGGGPHCITQQVPAAIIPLPPAGRVPDPSARQDADT
jgi:agmatine deiminase